MARDLVKTSKFLAYALRHDPDALGISLDDAGWVDLDELLRAMAAHDRPLSREELDRLINGMDKQRFEIRDGKIRAAQGHTIDVDLRLPVATPPAELYHGTVMRFLDEILEDGLWPMERTHVHLSPDVETARSVGARRGEPIILTIDAGGMHAAGHRFYHATNGVWLTDHVPPRWISLAGGRTPQTR